MIVNHREQVAWDDVDVPVGVFVEAGKENALHWTSEEESEGACSTTRAYY